MPDRLAAACPDGIDVSFDNVRAAIWQAVLPLLNCFACVPVCGLIANKMSLYRAPRNDLQATMRAVEGLRLCRCAASSDACGSIATNA